MDGEKAHVQLQLRPDLEKEGLRISVHPVPVSATQPLGPKHLLVKVSRIERPRSGLRGLLVFLAIAGFVFHAATRVFKHAGAEWNEQSSNGMIEAFAHHGKAGHGLYGKKAEELFLSGSIPLWVPLLPF